MMSCSDVLDRIDRLVAGTLDPADRTEVDRHLAECPDCQADVDAARFLATPVARLRREIAPKADLWTGIAPRLGARPRRLSLPVWWLAAAAVLLVAGTSVVTTVVLRRAPTPDAGSEAGFASTEARYRQAALEVADLYQKSRDSLATDTRVVLERNLVVIERALAEARDALKTDPTNRTLEAMVVAAYQRKIEFLERAAALDRKS